MPSGEVCGREATGESRAPAPASTQGSALCAPALRSRSLFPPQDCLSLGLGLCLNRSVLRPPEATAPGLARGQ